MAKYLVDLIIDRIIFNSNLQRIGSQLEKPLQSPRVIPTESSGQIFVNAFPESFRSLSKVRREVILNMISEGKLKPGVIFSKEQLEKAIVNRNQVMVDKLGRYHALTDKTVSHETTKHGHELGITDVISTDNSGKYTQTRTRLNTPNKKVTVCGIEHTITSPESDVYENITIRGLPGTAFHNSELGLGEGIVVGITPNPEFNITDPDVNITECPPTKISKFHSIGKEQLQDLKNKDRLD